MSRIKFTGTIGRTMAETDFKFDVEEERPKDAPNIVYILMDDMGFAHLGCYGSDIHTPNLDRLAEEGTRFNNFHTTAVCSATRASLLTGANHHAAGISGLVEIQTGCSNSQGKLNPAYGTIAEILKEYDYATFCSGKWHLAGPKYQAGPYDGWPLQKGFDRYYGFLHGEIDPRIAIVTETYTALLISILFNSSPYQRRENPVNLVSDLDELNENIIVTRIGR